MKKDQFSTKSISKKCGGVDVGKFFLDAAVEGREAHVRRENDAAGRAAIAAFFLEHGVGRVVLEASGGYEIEIVDDLRADGFETSIVQPAQVRAFAKAMNLRAKTDRIDAHLIADYASRMKTPARQADPRLAPLAERLTFLEQIEEDLARLRVRRGRFRDAGLLAELNAEIARLRARRNAMRRELVKLVRAHDDLGRRFALVADIDGIGERTALSLVIRMPELGSMSRGQAGSLAGLAPVTRESGRWKGAAHVGGGRGRIGRALFAAAQAACRQWNRATMALYQRLRAAGKHHNVAVVACARKLVTYANAVLARGTPWATLER
jgi:transposase